MSEKRLPRRGRIFPERTLAPEELAKRRTQRALLGHRCRQVFERVRPELIQEHYDWFIAIEPESEDYLIDPSLMDLIQKVRACYDRTELRLTIFRLNEAGWCGMI
ncbi:MAG: hypothetical protein AB4426_00800 [Xenococcaceae cyanobacterium]